MGHRLTCDACGKELTPGEECGVNAWTGAVAPARRIGSVHACSQACLEKRVPSLLEEVFKPPISPPASEPPTARDELAPPKS